MGEPSNGGFILLICKGHGKCCPISSHARACLFRSCVDGLLFDLTQYTVVDLTLPNNTWNVSLLATFCNADMMTLILFMPLEHGHQSDQLGWAFTKSLSITSKDIGRVLNPSYLQSFICNFSWIWYLLIPMRVRFLI